MRKDVKFVHRQITEEVVSYIAYDGTKFSDEEQCRKYEESAECAISAPFERLVEKECVGCSILDEGAPFAYESRMVRVHIRNIDDLEIVNRWIVVYTKGVTEALATEYIGADAILEIYDECVYPHISIESMVKNFREALEKHLGNSKSSQSYKAPEINAAKYRPVECVETCPYCEGENVYPNYDPAKNGYKVVCQHCGKTIFLCDECTHAEDNEAHKCDWVGCETDDGHGISKCFRGEYKY